MREPILPDDLGRIADEYDAIADEYDGEYKTGVDIAEDAFLQDRLMRVPRPARVFDLGCGTGLVAELMRPEQYVGVDLSGGMLSRAYEKFPRYKFVQGDMLTPPDMGRATLVTSVFGSPNYVGVWNLATTAFDLLSDDGRVLLMPFTAERYERHGHEIPADEAAHAVRAIDLERALVTAGFLDVRVTGFSDRRLDRLGGRWMRSSTRKPDRFVWLLGEGRR